jgi:hypothetical protein
MQPTAEPHGQDPHVRRRGRPKLPSHVSENHEERGERAPEPARQRQRRVLIADAPRMTKALEEIA